VKGINEEPISAKKPKIRLIAISLLQSETRLHRVKLDGNAGRNGPCLRGVRREVSWDGYRIHLSFQLKNKTWQQEGGTWGREERIKHRDRYLE
jgi:hypothetical protein